MTISTRGALIGCATLLLAVAILAVTWWQTSHTEAAPAYEYSHTSLQDLSPEGIYEVLKLTCQAEMPIHAIVLELGWTLTELVDWCLQRGVPRWDQLPDMAPRT